MKKILIITLLSTLSLATNAFAESSENIYVPDVPSFSTVSQVSENKVDIRTNSVNRLKERATSLISERSKALQVNGDAVAKNAKLTADQKTTLAAYLAPSVAGMTLLKEKVASSTDATSTKAIIESMYKDYRIFGIVIPRVRLETRIYLLKNHSTTLSDTFTKIQAKIEERKSKGYDVTSWQKGLDDSKMLVAGDMFKLDELLKQTATLTPSSYGTTSKAAIESVNSSLKAISKDFKETINKARKPSKLNKLPVTASSTAATSSVR